jgi:hypothetical protein
VEELLDVILKTSASGNDEWWGLREQGIRKLKSEKDLRGGVLAGGQKDLV